MYNVNKQVKPQPLQVSTFITEEENSVVAEPHEPFITEDEYKDRLREEYVHAERHFRYVSQGYALIDSKYVFTDCALLVLYHNTETGEFQDMLYGIHKPAITHLNFYHLWYGDNQKHRYAAINPMIKDYKERGATVRIIGVMNALKALGVKPEIIGEDDTQ